MVRATALLLSFQLITTASLASEKTTKGLIPEISLNSGSEVENDKKALSSEIMITRSENKAIASLQSIIKKKKGSSVEADLWYRLAELYMRRSKSGRFFDMHQDTPLTKLSPFPVPNEKGSEAIKRASKIYSKIETDFPQFTNMDAVFFNNAFALQQLGKIKQSEQLYLKLLTKFPKSSLIPDGTLAVGELLYDQGKFQEALNHFLAVEKFPKSRVYSYAMYKSAWSFYNIHESDQGIKKLVKVVKLNPPLQDGEIPSNRHNLRREALRDLTIFIGETYPANQLYSFFDEITTEEELGQSMTDLAKLYESHSRHKEMDIFLSEYIDKRSSGPEVVKSHLFLVEANEALKKREKVLTHLQHSSDLCRVDSVWKTLQNPAVVTSSCEEGFRQVSLEMARKWWDIWLKNKKNTEFADLTQRMFKLILDNEDPAKTDLKTRFAYAELLFQLDKFEEASSQYKIVGDKTTEADLRHDANYAALFAKEKSIEKEKNGLKEAERKELANNYLVKHANGKFATLVKFKLGHIAYEETNYSESEKILRPLAQMKGKENVEIKTKSEDLILDILNLRKDFTSIKEFSKSLLSTTTEEARKTYLNKILEEAHFTEIQEFAKNGDKNQASQKLIAFAKEHPDSKLSKEALWQALSLFYTEGRLYEAAELSQKYVQKYPEDQRNTDALKEAAKAYAELGQIQKSAETLVSVANLDKKYRNTHLELAADIYTLEKQHDKARKIYNDILANADTKTLARIYAKLLESLKQETDTAELLKVQNQILSKDIEPYATQIMISQAQVLLARGDNTAAFDLAMKANGRNAPAEIRAEARLIQARILEKELIQQSVKAREEKFALVLAMKTEKLDKAQTAYLTALKMSKDPYQQLEALRGIDRCYGNFIESLLSMPLPASLTFEDQSALRAEIAKMIAPIQYKKNENESKLTILAANKGQSATMERNFASLRVDQTVTPIARYPEASKLNPFIPASDNMTIGQVRRLEASRSKSCNKSAILTGQLKTLNIFEAAGSCFYGKKYDLVERLGLEIAKSKETRSLGLYLASLGSEAQGFHEKSMWLVEAALKNDPEVAPYIYQKARLQYQFEGLNSAMPLFEKVLDMQLPAIEMNVFAVVKAFSERDFTKSISIFSTLSKEQLYTYDVGLLISESFAQKGEVEKALNTLKELLNIKSENADMLLQQAHVFETYKGSPTLALDSYDKALKLSTQQDMRTWLEKKIQYLKTQTKVGQHVISGDL